MGISDGVARENGDFVKEKVHCSCCELARQEAQERVPSWIHERVVEGNKQLRGQLDEIKIVSGAITEVRSEVLAFAIEMEKVLRMNDHKGGWKEIGVEFLFRRLKDECNELGRCGGEDKNEIVKEAVDIANFAMMIADNSGLTGLSGGKNET